MTWGAFLRAIPPLRRGGDYAHATARLCNATQKRLQQDVSFGVQEGDGRGVIGCLKDVWGDLLQASQNIPQADHTHTHTSSNLHPSLQLYPAPQYGDPSCFTQWRSKLFHKMEIQAVSHNGDPSCFTQWRSKLFHTMEIQAGSKNGDPSRFTR